MPKPGNQVEAQQRFEAARIRMNNLGVPVIDPTPGDVSDRELIALESAAASFEYMADTGIQLPDEFTSTLRVLRSVGALGNLLGQ